jgi:hypothetical protein
MQRKKKILRDQITLKHAEPQFPGGFLQNMPKLWLCRHTDTHTSFCNALEGSILKIKQEL